MKFNEMYLQTRGYTSAIISFTDLDRHSEEYWGDAVAPPSDIYLVFHYFIRHQSSHQHPLQEKAKDSNPS